MCYKYRDQKFILSIFNLDSNSIELRIEFSDIKGIRTTYAFELVNEDVLDDLSKDVSNNTSCISLYGVAPDFILF